MLVFMVLTFCALLDRQPILDEADARGIDEEYAKRMRSLLSVDDMVVGLHALLSATPASQGDDLGAPQSEWDNSFVIFSR